MRLFHYENSVYCAVLLIFEIIQDSFSNSTMYVSKITISKKKFCGAEKFIIAKVGALYLKTSLYVHTLECSRIIKSFRIQAFKLLS